MTGKKDKDTGDLELGGGEGEAPQEAPAKEEPAEEEPAEEAPQEEPAEDEPAEDEGGMDEPDAGEGEMDSADYDLRDFSAGIDQIVPYDLMKFIETAEEVEIAFFDPDGLELPVPSYYANENDTWAIPAGGLELQFVPRALRVNVPPGEAIVLGGYALVLDDEVAAITRREEPLRMGGAMSFDLSGDVVFR